MTGLRRIVIGTVLLLGSAMAADQERTVVYRDEPAYPPLAERMHLHGGVKLKIWISPDGTVRRLEYVGGHPVLAEAALKAVKGWKYSPSSAESTLLLELKF
jgi:TonB family protein